MIKQCYIIILILISIVISQQNNDNDAILIKEESKNGSISPFHSSALKGDIVAQAFTFIFLIISAFDFLVYTILFLYVFSFVLRYSHFTKALMCITTIILFLAIRTIFIPLFINAIPYDWAPKLPEMITTVAFYLCTISYILFFNLPILACIYFVVKFGFSGRKLKGGIIDKSTHTIPNVVIMMPIYNEDELPLFRAVESAIRSDYPADKLHILLAFDDAKESALYWALLKRLKVLNKDVQSSWQEQIQGSDDENTFLFPPRLEIKVEGVRVTICRFPHGGKSATQGKGFKIISEMYGQDDYQMDNTLLMYIDSDVILHENALYNFVSTMVNHPKMKACTGYVTCRTSDSPNLLHYLQDAEYLEGQMFARSLEALAGSVTCLPGALTMLRLRCMKEIENQYFIDFDKRKPLNFHRYYLGEDRYMTHLLMESSKNAYTIGLCGASSCKTDAPDTWQKLIKQRRRWYLGALINEAHMLCTPKLWRTMPLLLSLKLFDYSTGSLSWLFMIYIIGVIKGVVPIWTICVFFPCLVLKYLTLSINASLMNRTKIFISFPVFFLINPIFKVWCTLYSIYTWDTRSWGGPRTDVQMKENSTEIMQQLMKKRQVSIKRSKKMLKQMKKRYRILNHNLNPQNEKNIQSQAENGAMPIRKLLPFPYEVEILGGGEYFTELIYPNDQSGYDSATLASPINPKYIFGQYQQSNPLSSMSSLDLSSLTRMEKLTSSPVNPNLLDPFTFSYRLSTYNSGISSEASSISNERIGSDGASSNNGGRSPLSNSTHIHNRSLESTSMSSPDETPDNED